MYQSGDGASVFDIRIDAGEASSGRADAEPTILFPDKDLLFTAAFKRSGADLLLMGRDATAVILDYFKGERRPGLTTYEGASLSGATVEALAGSDLPGQYAQSGASAATRAPIGRVEKVSGSVTVLRDGFPVELRQGDMVAKGDVVQTGPNSSVTIKFSDGTVFSLSSSARMVLNDMVYAEDATSNSMLFTLVQGVIGFVAGRIAKTGDLRVDTPVATMAIRGTAVLTEIAAASGVTKFSLLTEPGGTVGSFVLLDRNNPSRAIASISDAGFATLVTPVAATDLRITQVSKTADDLRIESDFVRDLFQVFSPEPRQRRGSSDTEDTLIVPANLPQQVDPSDSSQFFTPFIPERAVLRDAALPPLIPIPDLIRGTAVEDGPLAQLGALPDTGPLTGAALPLVSVPASLPPGVRYLEDARSFALDPSHPAYQHLGAGETQTVRVDYSLLVGGFRVPASVSWTISGRNDAPIAANDQVRAEEVGRTVLALRANDRDIDGDPLHVVRWTSPIEGSITRNASGDLVFDPGDDFRALSSGQTATVTFEYTLSDSKGGTDTASVSLQVRGAGVFSSPQQSASASGVLGFNQQPVSLTLGAPSATTTATADLNVIVGLGPVLQPQMNILYLVDVSGSTSGPFDGEPVGDLNGDGRANTILDAEIASLTALTERIRGLGFSPADVTVTAIPFNGSADPAASTGGAVAATTFSLGGAGEETIANFLRSLETGGQTNFTDALRAANDRLLALDQGGEANFVYFLSDGGGQGPLDAELATLNDVHEATIVAAGIGESADLSRLDVIDNTGGASLLTSPDQLDISVLGLPLSPGTIADLDIFLNGRQIADLGPGDFIPTSEGFALTTPIEGLGRLVGDGSTVSATVTFASGEQLAADLTIAGALPRSTDFVL